ncbi:MAG: DUF4190 domain-containing protein [Propionibacteriales bacterium]|nr:DUF4190 domain-containing protein [Propionibacteriales bacterium]
MSESTPFPANQPDASTGSVEYTQPAVPPLPDSGVDPNSLDLAPTSSTGQAYSLDLEPTQVDPFGSRGGDYPDFSYADQTYTQPIPDPVDPNPFPAVSNYAQPTVPVQPVAPAVADLSLAEPSGFGVQSATPGSLPATYQSYPAPAPVSDPIHYDYGYTAQPLADHPNALPSLILGIASLVIFSPLGIIGLILARKGRQEVAQNPGRWATGGTLTAGFVLSAIGTALTALAVIFFVIMFIVMFAAAAFN